MHMLCVHVVIVFCCGSGQELRHGLVSFSSEWLHLLPMLPDEHQGGICQLLVKLCVLEAHLPYTGSLAWPRWPTCTEESVAVSVMHLESMEDVQEDTISINGDETRGYEGDIESEGESQRHQEPITRSVECLSDVPCNSLWNLYDGYYSTCAVC